jgi:hypothetical protein
MHNVTTEFCITKNNLEELLKFANEHGESIHKTILITVKSDGVINWFTARNHKGTTVDIIDRESF